MSPRISTPETINAMIPLLSRIADDLDRAYFRVAMLYAMDAKPGRDEMMGCLDSVQELVTEFERLGGTVRSYSPVCVDFIADVDGDIGYLRWEQGSEEAGCFHGAASTHLTATRA